MRRDAGLGRKLHGVLFVRLLPLMLLFHMAQQDGVCMRAYSLRLATLLFIRILKLSKLLQQCIALPLRGNCIVGR